MSEMPIQDRAREVLKWIQTEQNASGLGMVEAAKIPDQGALRFLLRRGDVFEPQQGMIKSSMDLETEGESNSGAADNKPWIWKTPKPKKKDDTPEPYEFLAYPDWNVLPVAVTEALRTMGFSGEPYLFEGYSYRKMAGGAFRRKMLGTHSKQELLSELKLTCNSEHEYAELEEKIESKVSEYRGKYKEYPQVQITSNIFYYPKDCSFRITK
jgi:hypothetical protein